MAWPAVVAAIASAIGALSQMTNKPPRQDELNKGQFGAGMPQGPSSSQAAMAAGQKPGGTVADAFPTQPQPGSSPLSATGAAGIDPRILAILSRMGGMG